LWRIAQLSEIGEGGGFGAEGRNGFDEAGDAEGVADTARTADETQLAAGAVEAGRNTDERGNAGAVNLRDAIEIDDDFARSVFENGLKSSVELIGGFADGEASMEIEEMDARFFTDVNFDRSIMGHIRSARAQGKAGRAQSRHYTMIGWAVGE